MKSILCLALIAVLSALGHLPLYAEDWTTTDGKIYQKVTVVKSEPDAVTILYRDGGALVPLAKLPPDLQKRFHYDPSQAKAAADARAQADAKNAQALQAEMELAKEKKALALAQDKANAPKKTAIPPQEAPADPLHTSQFDLNPDQAQLNTNQFNLHPDPK